MVYGRVTVGVLPVDFDELKVQEIWNNEQLESVKSGDVVAAFKDYCMVWDEDCVPPSGLEPWRHEGDPLSDEVVRVLNLKPGQDGLQKVLDHLALPEAEQSDCVKRFWAEIAREPPEGITALPTNAASSARPKSHFTPQERLRNPERKPKPDVAEGQAVFWRYSAQIFGALLHFSLAGGFSANRVVNVLRETNYLTGEVKDNTYKRLLETTQAIMDYMVSSSVKSLADVQNDLTPITGQGWKSAVRVRLLHSTVRVRISAKMGTKKVYDEAVDGIPINQEDLIATLGSFAIAPLWSLRRMGIVLTDEEEEAYVAVWRHIGYYLGISPDRLQYYYSTVTRASKLFACNTAHLFSMDYSDVDYRTTSTYRLLSAVAERPPRKTPVEYHLGLSRFLLGDGLADRLAIPPTPRKVYWRMKLNFLIDQVSIGFGRIYTSRWEVERMEITRLLLLMIVCWQLGVRRTKFTIKAFQLDEEVSPNPAESEEKAEKVVDPDNDELDPEVTMGPEAGRRIISRWRWLIGEMVCVCVGMPMLAGVAAWKLSAFWR